LIQLIQPFLPDQEPDGARITAYRETTFSDSRLAADSGDRKKVMECWRTIRSLFQKLVGPAIRLGIWIAEVSIERESPDVDFTPGRPPRAVTVPLTSSIARLPFRSISLVTAVPAGQFVAIDSRLDDGVNTE
jgi:hypothetical protein